MNTQNLVQFIIENATMDSKMEPIKHNTRQRLVTTIVLVDDVESCKPIPSGSGRPAKTGLLFNKVGELDFWNEISGWFHANKNDYIPHPVYDFSNGSIEVPKDIELRHTSDILNAIVAGSYLVDKDYNLYRVYGFGYSSGKADIYLDFI